MTADAPVPEPKIGKGYCITHGPFFAEMSPVLGGCPVCAVERQMNFRLIPDPESTEPAAPAGPVPAETAEPQESLDDAIACYRREPLPVPAEPQDAEGRLREALQDLCDAIPDATVDADPPLGVWVKQARDVLSKHPPLADQEDARAELAALRAHGANAHLLHRAEYLKVEVADLRAALAAATRIDWKGHHDSLKRQADAHISKLEAALAAAETMKQDDIIRRRAENVEMDRSLRAMDHALKAAESVQGALRAEVEDLRSQLTRSEAQRDAWRREAEQAEQKAAETQENVEAFGHRANEHRLELEAALAAAEQTVTALRADCSKLVVHDLYVVRDMSKENQLRSQSVSLTHRLDKLIKDFAIVLKAPPAPRETPGPSEREGE